MIELKHQTRDEFLNRLREDYRNSSGERTVYLASFISKGLSSGDLTDAEVRAKFGSTGWADVRTRLNKMSLLLDKFLLAKGE